jgi:hypothetical protein
MKQAILRYLNNRFIQTRALFFEFYAKANCRNCWVAAALLFILLLVILAYRFNLYSLLEAYWNSASASGPSSPKLPSDGSVGQKGGPAAKKPAADQSGPKGWWRTFVDGYRRFDSWWEHKGPGQAPDWFQQILGALLAAFIAWLLGETIPIEWILGRGATPDDPMSSSSTEVPSAPAAAPTAAPAAAPEPRPDEKMFESKDAPSLKPSADFKSRGWRRRTNSSEDD